MKVSDFDKNREPDKKNRLKKAVKKSAWNRNRTSDTRIFSPLLYQLSYPGIYYHHKSI